MSQIPSSSSAAHLQEIFQKMALTFFVLLLFSFVIGLAEAAQSHKMKQLEEESFRDAVETGNYKKANEYLTKGVKIDAQSDDGWIGLHYAANRGYLPVLTFLVDRGLSVNIQDKEGATPLLRSSSPYQLIVIRKLLEWVADVNARSTKSGVTALMNAVSKGNLDVVKFLLMAGA